MIFSGLTLVQLLIYLSIYHPRSVTTIFFLISKQTVNGYASGLKIGCPSDHISLSSLLIRIRTFDM